MSRTDAARLLFSDPAAQGFFQLRWLAYLMSVAKHTARRGAKVWSGTPEALVELARDCAGAIESASGEPLKCNVNVDFGDGREAKYDSPEEFLVNFRAADSRKIKRVFVLYTNSDFGARVQSSGVTIVPGWTMPVRVFVDGADRSLVDGLAGRLVEMVDGARFGWSGLRRPDQTPRLTWLRTHIGRLALEAFTVAVTVAVTLLVHHAFS